MSQCTKEPCPNKSAIQKGLQKIQKRKKKKKLGETNPKKHKQEKKTPRSPTHEPEESSSQNSTDHQGPRTHSPTSNKALQSNTSPIRKLKPKRGRIPSRCHLIGQTVCTPCAKQRESPMPRTGQTRYGGAASNSIAALTNRGRHECSAGPLDTRGGTARPWCAV